MVHNLDGVLMDLLRQILGKGVYYVLKTKMTYIFSWNPNTEKTDF